MSVNSHADDLRSAVYYALETTRAITVCPFHLEVTIRIGDDAAESHAVARARNLVKSDGTTWDGEVLRTEFGRQLGKAADRYCPHCAISGGSPALYGAVDANRSRSAFGRDRKSPISWLEEQTEFACEGYGDLITLEKAKLRGAVSSPDKGWSGFLKRLTQAFEKANQRSEAGLTERG
ncbi:hypothetical protein I6F35_23025 [Bradyrhizobium sp. BRP22]|uniref:hypothetical protein n=1 Tax=Bradyrhizobium sp. BRP22 TaxID=2793821 RepID=UPI001CD43356|nr:hypothetical protein [Bradyrhizobium sp. BRP22]MCA1456044.1 hypothetical protein [Bradyrhizobium sp. BRP22]